MAEKQRPVFVFRLGGVSATGWENNREDGNPFYSVLIARSYRDQKEEWQQTNYFNHADLLNLAKLCERAEAWIAKQMARVVEQRNGNKQDQPDELDF